MTTLIERNSTIPCRKSQIFSTAADNQPAVSIHVLQGERELAKDNRTLARFDLVGLPPAPRGVPQIEVAFDIDANGIVHVSAKDLGTGKEQKIEIKVSSGLSQDQIDTMIKEAEEHAIEDEMKKNVVKVRNDAEILIYSTEQTMADHGDSIDEEDKARINQALLDLKDTIETGDVDDIRKATEKLSAAVYRIAELMYNTTSNKEFVGED